MTLECWKSDWAADTSVKIPYVIFTAKSKGKSNDTLWVLIYLRSIIWVEVPKQGHLIFSEPNMSCSSNWCEIFCNVTNIWFPFTHYLWFSLSPQSFTSSLPAPTFSVSSTRSRTDAATRQLNRDQKGADCVFIRLSLILFKLIMHCVTSNMTENKVLYIFLV